LDVLAWNSQQEKMDVVAEEWDDILLSHQYRLSLRSAPSQSSFRVLALIFYELLDEEEKKQEQNSFPFVWTPMSYTTTSSKTHATGSGDVGPGDNTEQQQLQRRYIVGTNDEPGFIGGAICAERAAMVQLRFAPPHRITKLVIGTDSTDPISPGLLCREFLAGHGSRTPQLQQLSWKLPVISSGSMCRRCQKRDQELFGSWSSSSDSSSCCIDDYPHHDIPVLQTSLGQLYPYPSPYTRLSAKDSASLGKAFCLHCQREPQGTCNKYENPIIERLVEMAVHEAQQQLELTRQKGPDAEIHPIYFGAAVAFRDGQIATSHQWSALEYGCTLDAVSQLATPLQTISKSSNTSDNHDNPPIWLVQVDQFGIAHAPFAPARAFLTEHGYGTCNIVLHDTENAIDASPTPDTVSDWKLIHVPAIDLAPHAPSWCTGTNKPTSTRKTGC
jgi:hypothetical protein